MLCALTSSSLEQCVYQAQGLEDITSEGQILNSERGCFWTSVVVLQGSPEVMAPTRVKASSAVRASQRCEVFTRMCRVGGKASGFQRQRRVRDTISLSCT